MMMRSTVVLTLTLIFALATAAQADVFSWTTDAGVVSFTDSEEQIPAEYKEASERFVAGSFKDFDRLTIASLVTPEVGALSALRRSRRSAETAPPTGDECTGHVTVVTTERRQFGEFRMYSRRIYVARDECGNVISTTFYYPEVRINR